MGAKADIDVFAQAVSKILHPAVLAVPAGLFVMLVAGFSVFDSLQWIAVTAIPLMAPILAAVWLMEKYRGIDTDARKDRKELYVAGLLLIAATSALSQKLAAPPLVSNTLYAFFLGSLSGGIANLYTKVSLHTGVVAAFATLLLHFSILWGSLGFLMTALVAWSRLRLGYHNPTQVLLGASLSSASVFLIFYVSPV